MNDTFLLNKAFCCPSFQNNIGNAGQRGFSIIVSKKNDGIFFTLQMRAISFEDELKVKAKQSEVPAAALNISLSGSLMIKFCPSCGKRLNDLANANRRYFEDIALTHKCFEHDFGFLKI